MKSFLLFICLFLTLSVVQGGGGRIVGGQSVPFGKYPSMVHSKDGGCAGTLIHEDIVLTAASCGEEVFTSDGVYIGGVEFDGSDGEFRNVTLGVPYNATSFAIHDIMILKLSTPSNKPIQGLNTQRGIPKADSIVTAIGYGSNAEGVSNYQDLHEANLTAYSDPNCSAIWKGIDPKISFPAINYLCAGVPEGGRGDCEGDGGGPLYDINTKKQIGVIAFGVGCARPTIPSGFTRVSTYTNWLKTTICRYSNNPPISCTYDAPSEKPSSSPSKSPSKSPLKSPSKSPLKSPLAPVAATPVAATPVAATPVAATPVAATPVAATPVAATPVASTPAATPVVATAPTTSIQSSSSRPILPPVAATPVVATPVAAKPVAATPIAATPVAATPVAATPVASAPVAATPVAVAATPVAKTPVAATPIAAKPSSPLPATPSALLVPTPSIPTAPKPTRIRYGFCFSGTSTVEVKDIGQIPITSLRIGDYVKSGNNNINGLSSSSYTQVYGFGHYDHDQEVEFIQIYFVDDGQNEMKKLSPLEISPLHYVFVQKTKTSTTKIVPASDIVIGDILSGYIVSNITRIIRRGIYAPLTQSGDIMVNNIRASNYVKVLQHFSSDEYYQHILGHSYYFPQRLFCQHFIESCKKETYNKDGYGYVSYYIVYIGYIINQYGGWYGNVIFQLLNLPYVAIVNVYETIITSIM